MHGQGLERTTQKIKHSDTFWPRLTPIYPPYPRQLMLGQDMGTRSVRPPVVHGSTIQCATKSKQCQLAQAHPSLYANFLQLLRSPLTLSTQNKKKHSHTQNIKESKSSQYSHGLIPGMQLSNNQKKKIKKIKLPAQQKPVSQCLIQRLSKQVKVLRSMIR